MKNFFKLFLKRVGLNGQAGITARYIKNKNIISGHNTDISNLQLYIQDATPGTGNIVIGNNCIIEGKIIVHNRNARVTIGDRVFIGHSSQLICYDSITIGDDVMLSWNVTVMDTDAHSLHSEERKNDVTDWQKGPENKNWSVVNSKKINIGPKCWIGFQSIILKGVNLGSGTVVAAGSVVTNDSSPFSVIGGNPARFIKQTD